MHLRNHEHLLNIKHKNFTLGGLSGLSWVVVILGVLSGGFCSRTTDLRWKDLYEILLKLQGKELSAKETDALT